MKQRTVLIASLCVLGLGGGAVVVLTSGNDGEAGGTDEASRIVDADAALPLVNGDAVSLILQQEDLPPGFMLAQGQPRPPQGYSRVYLNRGALVFETGEDPELYGVISDLSLFATRPEAANRFAAQGGLTRDAILADIRAKPGAEPRDAQPVTIDLPDVDRATVFLVHYLNQGMDVYEYRYRILVANALSNLVLSTRAPADGTQPPLFSDQARTIVDRQIKRLTAATTLKR